MSAVSSETDGENLGILVIFICAAFPVSVVIEGINDTISEVLIVGVCVDSGLLGHLVFIETNETDGLPEFSPVA